MQLGELISGLDVRAIGAAGAGGGAPALNVRICDLTEDSRTVMPGSLYVARKGEKSDGRAFIAAAVKAGAVAVLIEAAEDVPGLLAGAGIGGWLGRPDGGRRTCGSDSREAGETAQRSAAPDIARKSVLPTAAGELETRTTVLVTPNLPLALSHLGERFYGEPSSQLAVIGVTGTNGKTTTTYLIHQMLNAMGVRCGLIGTVVIDDGVEVAPASMTTPPALELSRTLARMLEAGCRAVVLEVSSHSLHQHRVAAVKFDVGVFTNLTGDHLDYHKTMDAYADAKAMLFKMLPGWENGKGGTAIVNGDDPASERMLRGCNARVWRTCVRREGSSTAAEQPPECVASVIGASRFGSEASLVAPWMSGSEPRAATMIVPMVGGHNVMNSLQAACAAAAVLDGSVSNITATCNTPAHPRELGRDVLLALSKCGAPPGRLECITSPSDPITVYVDYAHTDDALRTVLVVLKDAITNDRCRASPKGDAEESARRSRLNWEDPTRRVGPPGREARLIVVFGCGGDRDATKRPRMGKVAAELADCVYVTSDNPRTEDAMSIIRQILMGMGSEAAAGATVEPDRERAIRRAVHDARPGDIIIIAGKGHEDYQILPVGPIGPDGRAAGTVKRYFDDRLVAGAALAERGIAVRAPSGRAIHANSGLDQGAQ